MGSTVNRQPSTVNRQPVQKLTVKKGIFLPSNEEAKISRQISKISLNDRDRLGSSHAVNI